MSEDNFSLSHEQRMALDSIKHACKDGTISNASLWNLLCNLKNILDLKSKDGVIKVTMPNFVASFLNVTTGDKVHWETLYSFETPCVLVTKSKSNDTSQKEST